MKDEKLIIISNMPIILINIPKLSDLTLNEKMVIPNERIIEGKIKMTFLCNGSIFKNPLLAGCFSTSSIVSSNRKIHSCDDSVVSNS